MLLQGLLTVLFFSGINARAQLYILDGYEYSIKDAPYMVSITIGKDKICGGVIITRTFALTAASCVDELYDYSKILVRSRSDYRTRDGDIHKIVDIHIHDLYDQSTSNFDFALIEVQQPFAVRGGASIVNLPNCWTEPRAGEDGLIFGWGTSTVNGLFERKLRVGKVYIKDRRKCNTLSKDNKKEWIGTMFCASGVDERHTVDTCDGDEGGPLIVNNTLVGITSFGLGCGNEMYPGVYGNVGHYFVRSWISKFTGRYVPNQCFDVKKPKTYNNS